MKIDLNKRYRTREGRAVSNLRYRNCSAYPIIGKVEGYNVEKTWTNEGRCYGNNIIDDFDLVEVPETTIKPGSNNRQVTIEAPYGSNVSVDDNGHGIVITVNIKEG